MVGMHRGGVVWCGAVRLDFIHEVGGLRFSADRAFFELSFLKYLNYC